VIEPEVLASHDRPTVCWVVVPEPFAVSETEPELPVKKEMFADTVLLVVGAKDTVKGTL